MGKFVIEKHNGESIWRLYENEYGDIAGEEAYLTPYTEPDLEQVRKEAYKEGREAGIKDGKCEAWEAARKIWKYDKGKENSIGYKIGYKKGYIDGLNRISDYEDKIRKEAYEDGLKDAWDAARKICTNWVLPDSVLSEIFGMNKTIDDIMKENTASEAIEKIRQYEREKDAEIKVGDEVELKCGVRPAIYMQGTKGSDEIYLLFNDGSCGVHSKSEIVRKTGRHFHEIATILENMRGEQDG